MEKYTHHAPPPCFEAVSVLYVDEHLLVVNKPQGLLSVPGRIVKDCVINRMVSGFPDAVTVHRLDLDTSGVLVLSRSKLATSELNRQFRERTVSKQYSALVYGLMAEQAGEINLAIAPDWENRPRQRIDAEVGKAALTHFEVVARGDNQTQVCLRPVTGRSHQLRIHMAHIGYPILGCDLYAHDAALGAAPRLCLHAEKITINHPASGERLSFECSTEFSLGSYSS